MMPSTKLLFITSVSLSLLSASATPAIYSRSREVTSSAKTGMAWPNGDANNITQYYNPSSKVSWYYTWSPAPISDNSLEFVPMLWGAAQADAFASTIQSTISSKTVHAVLGMNEPNLDSQSSLKPEDAAGIWKSHIQPLKGQGLRLGSPAVTSAPDGKTWYQSFFGACDGCTVDFLALHYYGTNATQLIDYITDMHNTFQLPIWVTEFACQSFTNQPQCDYKSTMQFMHDTTSFMDQTEWVERYSWFGAMENLQGVNPDNALLDKQGKITPLGDQYIGVASSGDSQPGSPVTASKGHTVQPALLALLLIVLFHLML